jgi:nucleotide-binding universal stress UspA family protein
MYQTIIAPTDGSDFEKAAIAVAASLAERFDATLHLVQVLAPPITSDTMLSFPATEITEQALEEEKLSRLRKLEKLGEEVRANGRVRVETDLKEGNVTQTLVEYAKQLKADLIVMSSHSRGGLQRVSLGSVTDFLIRNTHRPVLVVRPDSAFVAETSGTTETRIVVPLDGSPLAEQILPEVTKLASAVNAAVTLVHVLTPQTYSQKRIMQPGLPWWDTDMENAEAYLSWPVNYLIKHGISATKQVMLHDDVATAILDYAIRNRADVIAIATNGIGGLQRFVFGTVADELTRKSPMAVLVVHPDPDGAGNKASTAAEVELAGQS